MPVIRTSEQALEVGNKPLRYVQIGIGGWGQHWYTEVLPRLRALGLAEAVAAVDINPEVLRAAKENLSLWDDQLYTDAAEAVAATRPDFVIIVVPPAKHEAMVDIAVEHKCHILSEKPIADTMAACVRIHKKVTAAGLKMAVTMSHRFDQDKQSLEQSVKSGKYGPLNYIVHRFTHNCREFGSWGVAFRHQIPDPLLIEGAVHHFDCLRAISNANAKVVYAVAWNPPWGEYAGDSTALVTIMMENGVKCFYEGAKANASTLNGWENDYIRAECRDGTLELDQRRLHVLHGPAWEAPASEELSLLEQPVWKNAWLAELFVHWLNGGDAPPNILEDNLQCAALLFAAIESAHTRQPVDVSAFLARHLGND
ncbi:MAG TPA: Gfo/Idh/MocA family oxidoreductase [Candidatus Hydrogenedentes bacterium]|nr:Gfo/Idh/MocA family oxidoreductase [Candidatus Hydrogenedentota bacterium]